MNHLTKILDKVASDLEMRGLTSLAKQIDVVSNTLEQSQKVLIVMRGASGSGKSTKAKELGVGGVVLSTDDFFMQNGQYNFNPEKIAEAHQWNQQRAVDEMKKGTSPIVIDNTNTQKWEAKPYVLAGKEHGYTLVVEEPNTPWKFDIEELGKRNQHGVPIEVIERMVENIKGDHSDTWDSDSISKSKAPWE